MRRKTVAKLVFRSGMHLGKNMSLPQGKAIVLGRNRDVDLPLNDAKLSRRHCQITATQNGCIITDLSSTNGTFVNGNRIEAGLQLELIEFDRIVLGDTEIELYLSEDGERNPAVSSDDHLPVVKAIGESSSFPKAVHIPAAAVTIVANDDEEDNAVGEPESSADPDALLAALYEMSLQLPPEPPPASAAAPLKSEPVYCSYCGSKISEEDRSSGSARVVQDKLACKECLVILPPENSAKPDVDNMLAMLSGLDDEPIVFDTSKRPRLTAVEHDAHEATNRRHSPPVAPPPVLDEEPEKQSVFGDEFEEIG